MTINIQAPTFPEEIQNAWISEIYVSPGAFVYRDDLLFDIETDKVVLEVVAPANGEIIEYYVKVGEHISSAQVIANFIEKDSFKVREVKEKKKINVESESVNDNRAVTIGDSVNSSMAKISGGVIVGIILGLVMAYVQFRTQL